MPRVLYVNIKLFGTYMLKRASDCVDQVARKKFKQTNTILTKRMKNEHAKTQVHIIVDVVLKA